MIAKKTNFQRFAALMIAAVSAAIGNQSIFADDPAAGTDTAVVHGVVAPRSAIGVADRYDDVATATGDILEARGELAKDRGKSMFYRSLSAKQLQQAIDQQLDNRRERVETYFELRDLNDKEREQDGFEITSEKAEKLAKMRAPNRLGDDELDAQSGKIDWPGPLAADALKVYRRPIEASFDRRSSPGEAYGQFDFYRVQRMVNLMHQAIETIEDELVAREIAAIGVFLDRVAYEARFDSSGQRIDY